MLIDQIIEWINPGRNGDSTTRNSKIYIGGTALGWNHPLVAFIIFMGWSKRMMASTRHTLEVFALRCTAQATLGTTGTFDPHISKRRGVAG